jgi:peptidoglycan/LPS O-acetylase OafA/YrhL
MATSGFPAHEFCFPFFAMATVSFFARLLAKNATGEHLSWFGQFLRLAGTYSYSIYLIHHPLLVAITDNYKRFFPGIENNPVVMFFAALSSAAIIFPLGALCYHFLEKPSIALGKRVLRGRSERLRRQTAPARSPAGDVLTT